MRQGFLLLLFIAGLSCGRSGDVRPEGLPSLQVTPAVLDLGTAVVSSNGELKLRVTLKNLGTGLLHVDSVHSSCGCTVVHSPRARLEPGQSDTIEVVVKVGFEASPRNSTVTIESNDPTRSSFPVRVHWKAEPRIFLEPSQVDFGSLRPGDSAERKVEVRLASRDNSKLRVESTTQGLKMDWEDAPDQTRVLRANLVADGDVGEHRGTIVLTGVESDLASMIPIHWRVKTALRVTPSSLYNGEAVSGEFIEGRLFVASEEAQPFRVESARIEGGGEQEPPALPASAAPRHELKVRVRVPEKHGVHRMIIRIATDMGGSGSQLEVPWSLVVH